MLGANKDSRDAMLNTGLAHRDPTPGWRVEAGPQTCRCQLTTFGNSVSSRAGCTHVLHLPPPSGILQVRQLRWAAPKRHRPHQVQCIVSSGCFSTGHPYESLCELCAGGGGRGPCRCRGGPCGGVAPALMRGLHRVKPHPKRLRVRNRHVTCITRHQ